MKFEKLEITDYDSVLKIAIEAYKEEQTKLDYLPNLNEMEVIIGKSLNYMLKNCEGFCVKDDNKVVGYIISYEVNNLFGKENGVYIPLYGHGAVKENRNEIYQKLYTCASEYWSSKGLTSHSITMFTQDEKTVNDWFWLGFGLRCVDSIAEVKNIPIVNNKIIVKKAVVNDLDEITEIYKLYGEYFSKSPLFMYRDTETIDDLKKWLQENNNHLWIAYSHGKPVGFMQIQNEGESYISNHNGVMNITGAFVYSEERCAGIGQTLLVRVFRWLKENNYKLCGVDFESFNIPGSKFWNRHFTPYTFSLVRRLDERIKN